MLGIFLVILGSFLIGHFSLKIVELLNEKDR